jgi:hypothetical protein
VHVVVLAVDLEQLPNSGFAALARQGLDGSEHRVAETLAAVLGDQNQVVAQRIKTVMSSSQIGQVHE